MRHLRWALAWPFFPALFASCALQACEHGNTSDRGPRPGEWGIAMGPAGITPDFDQGSIGGFIEIDHFPSEHVSFSLRHIGDYEDNHTDTSISVMRFGCDWSPSRTEVEPFAGLSLGWAFGERVNESGLAGAQAGLRYWQQQRAFLQVVGGYDWFWTTTEDESEYYHKHAFTLLLGVGLLF